MSDIYVVTEVYERDGYGSCEDVHLFSSKRDAETFMENRMSQLAKTYREVYGDGYIIDRDGHRIRPGDSFGDVDDVTLEIWFKGIE